MSLEPLQTASGSDFPCCHQLSVFVENRLGQFLRLTRYFENTDLKILAVMILPANECAVVRMIVNHPEAARTALVEAGFSVTETDVLVVELPQGKRGIRSICEALIAAEVNMEYIYPLFPLKKFEACLAIQSDERPQAAAVLINRQFRLIDQSELT